MTSLADAIAEVKRFRANGDLLRAFDRAYECREQFPDSEELKHAGLVALARAGATDRAAQLFHEWGLDKSENSDILALEARIAKDRALKLKGDARRAALLEAAHDYRQIYEREPNYYPAINWASLAFLAGEREEAARVATIVLADPAIRDAGDYWALATRAEAMLVLEGPGEGASDALKAAAAAEDADPGNKSSTRRQLRLILTEWGLDGAAATAFLAPLAARVTLHYLDPRALQTGWRGCTPSFEEEAGALIRAKLAEIAPGAVYGSLASPAEVLFAEAALADGRELELVLPVPLKDFERLFVADAGEDWRERIRACCANAKRVEFALDDASVDDPSLSEYAARMAMGLALLNAQHLDGDAAQVLLGPAEPGNSRAEAAWRSDVTRKQIVLPLPGAESGASGHDIEPRPSCAVIFGDVPGFSKLKEKALPVFYDTVMGAVGKVVDASADAVATKNTWGDAIHLVVPNVRSAAAICLDVQRALAALDSDLLGQDRPPTMRIGAHFGPVFEGWDAVRAVPMFYGNALSKAARIEPITPPGTVYVTEAFAAILLLESHSDFTCTYVGQVPLAKNYGVFSMYDLRAETAEE